MRIAGILVLAAALAAASSGVAAAQSSDVPCLFASSQVTDPLKAAGASGALAQNGYVDVVGLLPYYETEFVVEVAVWVDDAFLATTPDAAAYALRYFEHANCVLAAGKNKLTQTGSHHLSLRLAGNRIRYYKIDSPPVIDDQPWVQQMHWDWANAMAGMSGIPKVNVMFTTRPMVDTALVTPPVWFGSSASNGVGQGNALVGVDPNAFQNSTAKKYNEDWWGLVAAHELGHAMGRGGHTVQHFDSMCCDNVNGTDYEHGEQGTTPSRDFSMSEEDWDMIVANDIDLEDNYDDPYREDPNPVTGVPWNFSQISEFLVARSGGDVYVANATTGGTFTPRYLRHEWFCIGDEVCLTGDFDGDGKADVAAFTRGVTGDVFVALSTGNAFQGTGVKWHDFFAINNETPLVGDFNGDGKDDIAAFTGGSSADVYVALSTGHSFVGTGVKWHDLFAGGTEVPRVGDFNGDGKDDIASFTRGSTGDVYVALSTGASFGARTKWHDWFCINSETPVVGDWNGDGRDDIATLTGGAAADVYVALAGRGSFVGTGVKWHNGFAGTAEVVLAGDLDKDGKDDLIAFNRGLTGRIYAVRSLGTSFSASTLWGTDTCVGPDLCGVADMNGDGRADAFAFHRHD